jgi:YgiT-type zinc finger domain-containing protein
MNEDKDNERYACLECQAGIMRKRPKPYFTWLYGELVTVPDFPAWVCDVCGRREFDSRAVSWLNILLNPATGRSSRYPQRKPGPADRTPDSPQPFEDA